LPIKPFQVNRICIFGRAFDTYYGKKSIDALEMPFLPAKTEKQFHQYSVWCQGNTPCTGYLIV